MITIENILELAENNEVYADTPSFYDYRVRVLKTFVSYKLSNGEILNIAPGFEWDEASVPWLFIWAFPKSGRYSQSAMVHDALYYKMYRNRKFADNELFHWMKATLCSDLQIRIRYCLVRLFGGAYWNRNVTSKRTLKNQSLITIT